MMLYKLKEFMICVEVIENEVRIEEDGSDYWDWYLVVKYGDNIISTTSSTAVDTSGAVWA